MTILIVEDEPKALQLLKAHFESGGHQVLGCDTGEAAIALLGQHHPQVMLLDLWLKGAVNGLGVLKEVKRVSPHTKVIVVTGFEDTSQEDVVKLGAAALLKKPIRLEELNRFIESVCNASA